MFTISERFKNAVALRFCVLCWCLVCPRKSESAVEASSGVPD